MEINGKKYKINADVTFGILEDLETNEEDIGTMKRAIKEFLIPEPSNKDIRAMRLSQLFKIMNAFKDAQVELNIDLKKKLS